LGFNALLDAIYELKKKMVGQVILKLELEFSTLSMDKVKNKEYTKKDNINYKIWAICQ
jgi:hypothetical protein